MAARLLARWPVRARGAQRFWFAEDGFALTVIHAPAAEALAGVVGAVDAWFLDGFAPARNPAMWDAALIARIAALSAPGARLATYSVAGAVRRALAAAGFSVEKKPGFSGKRERLEARLTASPPASTPSLPYHVADIGSVAVIGAGIAGASVAAALQRRGVGPVVYDAAPAPASGASGNPAALLSPRLDRTDTGVARLFLAAHLEALAYYRAIGAFDRIGVVQRPRDAAEAAALADLVADPPLPDTHFRFTDGGVLHVEAGIVRPRAAIDAMLAGSTLRLGVAIESLERVGEVWLLRDGDGRVVGEATAVVIANGVGLARFAQTRWAPLEFTRGQLEWGPLRGSLPVHGLESGTYAAPFEAGIVFGATFDRTAEPALAPTNADSRARNLAALAALSPDLAERLDPTLLTARAAIRAAMPDRAPMAGAAPDADIAAQRQSAAPVHPGLYLLGAFGSRGFTLAPLLGERIAAEMMGEPQALDEGALEAAHPSRFFARTLRRGPLVTT